MPRKDFVLKKMVAQEHHLEDLLDAFHEATEQSVLTEYADQPLIFFTGSETFRYKRSREDNSEIVGF